MQTYKCSDNTIKAEIVTVFLCAIFEIKAGRTRHPLWCCGNRNFATGSTKDMGQLLPKLSITNARKNREDIQCKWQTFVAMT